MCVPARFTTESILQLYSGVLLDSDILFMLLYLCPNQECCLGDLFQKIG